MGGQDSSGNCLSCQKYEDNPILGHTKCSVHRACAGESMWEPTNCESCIALKHDYDKMTTENRNELLQNLRKMLSRMNYNFKAKKIDWEYRMIVSSFLETDLSTTPTTTSNQSSRDDQSLCGGSSTDNTLDQTTLDIQNWISAVDKDTLVTLIKASLQKTGGAQESNMPQPRWENNIQGQEQYPLSGYSRSTPESEPQY